MGTDGLKERIELRAGDLVISKDSNEAGILMQKHKVLRSGTEPSEFSRWYYAWRIKWNREASQEDQIQWSSLLESTYEEKKLIRNIKDGTIEYYSRKNIVCN
tara:strand:+ start:518 stop:823 length:306 start_codon:yes stop_codon:yes gene_type:complete